MGQEHKTNETVIEVPPGSAPVKVAAPKGRRKKFPFQGYLDFQGLKIDVENLQGSTRKGTAPDGKAWETIMHWPYGEIRGTEGTDGDKLDCYVGPNGDSPLVVVIHQRVPETGAFDEDKAMLGFNSEEEAVGAYKRQYDHPGFYQDHTAMPIGQFGRWVEDRKNKGKRIVNKSFFSALLSKAMERGGKYLKKLPKPGGGYTYIYAHTKDSPHATAAEHHAHHAKVQNALAQTYEAKAHKEGDADDILSLNNRMKQHHREAARAHHQAASGARRVKKQGLFQRQSEKEHTGGLFAGTPKGEKKTDLFGQSSSGKYAGDRSGKTEQKSEDTRRDTARDSVEKTARTNKLLGQAGLGTDPGKWDKAGVRSAMDKIRREKDSPDKASAMRALNNWGVLQMEGVVKNLKKSLLFGAAFGGDVDLSKGGEGGSHKYVKRIPKPGGGYSYVYSLAQHKAAGGQGKTDSVKHHRAQAEHHDHLAAFAYPGEGDSGEAQIDRGLASYKHHRELAAHHATLHNLHMRGAADKPGEPSTGAKIVQHPSGDGFAVEHVERGNRHPPIGEKGQSRQDAIEAAAVILHGAEKAKEEEKKRDAEKKPKTPQLAPPLPPEAYKPAPKAAKKQEVTSADVMEHWDKYNAARAAQGVAIPLMSENPDIEVHAYRARALEAKRKGDPDAAALEDMVKRAEKAIKGAEKPEAKPTGSEHVGRKWASKEGEREVVGIHEGTGKMLVTRPGLSSHALISPERLEGEISFDKKNAAQHAKATAAAAETADKEGKQQAEKDDTDGFADSMSPHQKQWALAALNKKQSFNGKTQSRKEFIRNAVKDGASTEKDPKYGRRIHFKNGGFMYQKDVSKTGMDYAEHLIGKKEEKPDAKPTPEKSMKLQRTKTKQLPLSFGKSFFLDILEGRSILSKSHKKPGDVVRCGKSGREGAVVRVNDGGYVVKWIDDKGGTGFIADGDVREKGAKKSFTFSAIFHK